MLGTHVIVLVCHALADRYNNGVLLFVFMRSENVYVYTHQIYIQIVKHTFFLLEAGIPRQPSLLLQEGKNRP